MFFLYNETVGEDMKKRFISTSEKMLKSSGKYNNDEIEIIVYGLEGLYLSITKMIIIFSIAIVLGIFEEVFILLVTYNIIRNQAFGIHASKSIYCLISSIIFFIGGAILCKYIVLPHWLMVGISIICNICLLRYAPADTYKHPIINLKKRKRFKMLSFGLGSVYTFIIVVMGSCIISNYLLFGMIEAVLMILPITYATFKLPYNNYKNYYNDVELISNN